MDIQAHGFFHELFGNPEPFRQLPDLAAARSNCIVQLINRDQLPDGPFIGTVFVPLADIMGRIAIVKAAGCAVAQLMAQMDALQNITVKDRLINADAAGTVFIHDGNGAGLRQGKIIDWNA